MKQITREFIVCTLWTAALVVMIFGTIDSLREGHNSLALAWGIFLSVAALTVTCWALIRRHHTEQEISVERVIEISDALHAGRRQTTHLR